MNKNLIIKNVLDLLKSGEKKFFIENEIEVASFVSECFDSSDPELIDLCFYLSRLAESEKNIYAFSEVANIIIEDYIDGETYLEKAIDYLKNDSITRTLSPFWLLVARTSYRDTEDFKSKLKVEFLKEPSFFAEVMLQTQDIEYAKILKDKLIEVAPYIKYLPRYEGSHEIFWEHDFWFRGGHAFMKLNEFAGEKSKLLPFDYLNEMFLIVLPKERFEWLSRCSDSEKEKFEKKYKIYCRESNIE